ncbi:MAG: ExbD/TolR family protein, partial [Phycisphaerae bacterium]
MKIVSQTAQRTSLTFNITPLIDVVFLLIIFFLVASHFVRHDSSDPVSLPLAELGQQEAHTAPVHLTVTIMQNGQLSVNGHAISEQFLRQRIKDLSEQNHRTGVEPELRIRCDQQVEYLHV